MTCSFVILLTIYYGLNYLWVFLETIDALTTVLVVFQTTGVK